MGGHAAGAPLLCCAPLCTARAVTSCPGHAGAPLPSAANAGLALPASPQRFRATNLCALPILRSQVWQQRIAAVHHAVESLPLLSYTLAPSSGADAAACRCHSFVTLCQLTLVAASFAPAARLQAWIAGLLHSGGSSSGDASDDEGRGCCATAGRLTSTVRGAVAWANVTCWARGSWAVRARGSCARRRPGC